jgi:hypothetical protein
VDGVGVFTGGRGIWTMDRGADRRYALEGLQERELHFVIRSTGKRTVIDRRQMKGTVAEVAGRGRQSFAAKVIRIEGGKEKFTNCGMESNPSSCRSERKSCRWWSLPASGKNRRCCSPTW